MPAKVYFVNRYPDLAKTIDYSRCSKEDVSELGVDDRKYEVWWKCSICKNSYPRTVSSRVANIKKKTSPCPYCTNVTLLRGFNDLASTHPNIASQWDFKLNSPLTPSDVLANDTTPVYWLCKEGHSSQTHPQARAIQGKICGVCRNKRVQAGVNDLFTTNPELRAMWDHEANSELNPAKLTRQSKKRAHWICSNGHSFESTIKARAYLESDCNYCINRKVMPGFNDLQTLHPEIALQFDVERNGMSPSTVLAGTSESFFWLCPEGHSWAAKVSNRVSANQSGCPGCSSTGFDSTRVGVFYVISSPDLGAMKIGITNPESKSDRIKGWIEAGWDVLFTFEADGVFVQSLELQMKQWIKLELGLSSYLSKQEVGKMRGASETFSSDSVSSVTVIDKAKTLIAELNAKAHKH
jgi:hypothetical protein